MPRRPRALGTSDYYHVINRGSVRARLFYTPGDYDAFVALLCQAIERHDLALLAYCVMPSHWHLVVRPVSLDQLSRSLHWLTCTHAMRWCRAHTRRGPGPLYQGRFKSIPVEDDDHLVRLCRYVERNALKAKLVARAEQWQWSSANQRLQKQPTPRLLSPQFLTNQEGWLETLNVSTVETDIARAIRHGRPLGTEEWTRNRRKALGLSESGKRGRPPRAKLDPSLL